MKGSILLLLCTPIVVHSFTPAPTFNVIQNSNIQNHAKLGLHAIPPISNQDDETQSFPIATDLQQSAKKLISHVAKPATAVLLSFLLTLSPTVIPTQPATAADGAAIAACLFKKCQIPLAKCIVNPNCLANVICINTCNGKPDESGCQIECGNIFENDVVGEFNKCAVSDMTCVPQKPDDGSYPVPTADKLVDKLDTKIFNGRWYISAGQNALFDIFPCQVHFFTESGPGKFFGKLNWRVEEPDGEFFTRDALQRFVQDPAQPAHLINHDNEYLHYEDDWYVLDYEYDDNPSGVPPFVLVYYRGANDAWIGYGGAVVYTRAAQLPEELIPRLREGVKKVNFDWDKDFTITDNTCKSLSSKEALILKEKFAGKEVIQTAKQLQSIATNVRGNAINTVKAQKIFFENEAPSAVKAYNVLNQETLNFEKEIQQDAMPAAAK
mmetsp:Transcript_55483/g.66740  ORF Transcript_55483/g.66740 Transcript_55483/m.66740 type:complete len:438 (-) Transcript_55483:20-1333(-)|eukprot:CAMPEP_0172483200 /NCGR_PEP_ID=MMETSP1066-20121228/10088_1 /TAXON_ID=671091 /ORGANISM="Coscinodiscus wailesii, Strain CCMP2513" /LENGTH=437 /DNA_ID=CAMNT_0013246931 /DNA_START=112 /DNA_END=1425 /DNA_ORIENTATION=-